MESEVEYWSRKVEYWSGYMTALEKVQTGNAVESLMNYANDKLGECHIELDNAIATYHPTDSGGE